jgi:anti-sigma-K factor RskA
VGGAAAAAHRARAAGRSVAIALGRASKRSVDGLAKASKASKAQAAGAVGWWNNLKLWRGLAAGGFAMAAAAGRRGGHARRVCPGPQYMVVLVAPRGQVARLGDPGQRVAPAEPGAAGHARGAAAEDRCSSGPRATQWRGPVSLGLVKQRARPLRIPIDKLPPLEPNQLFELTLEPENGSPIDRPTGPIQFIGRAVKVM